MMGFRRFGHWVVVVGAISVATSAVAVGADQRAPQVPRDYDLTYETPGPEIQDAEFEIVAERFGHVYSAERVPIFSIDYSGRREFLGSIRKGARVKLNRWRNFKGRHFYAIEMKTNLDITTRMGPDGKPMVGDGIAWIDGIHLVPVPGTYTPAPVDKFHWWSGGGEKRFSSGK